MAHYKVFLHSQNMVLNPKSFDNVEKDQGSKTLFDFPNICVHRYTVRADKFYYMSENIKGSGSREKYSYELYDEKGNITERKLNQDYFPFSIEMFKDLVDYNEKTDRKSRKRQDQLTEDILEEISKKKRETHIYLHERLNKDENNSKCRPYFDLEISVNGDKFAQEMMGYIIDTTIQFLNEVYPKCKVITLSGCRPHEVVEGNVKYYYKVSFHFIVTGYFYEHPKEIMGHAELLFKKIVEEAKESIKDRIDKHIRDGKNIVDISIYKNCSMRTYLSSKEINGQRIMRYITNYDMKMIKADYEEGSYTMLDITQTLENSRRHMGVSLLGFGCIPPSLVHYLKENITDYVIQYPRISTEGLIKMEPIPCISNTKTSNKSSETKAKIINADPTLVEYIRKLLGVFPDEYADDFAKWQQISMCMVNISMKYNVDLRSVGEEFSKRSDKFDETDFEKDWDKLVKNNINRKLTNANLCGLTWLREECKKINADRYASIESEHKQNKLNKLIIGSETVNDLRQFCQNPNLTEDELQDRLQKSIIRVKCGAKEKYFMRDFKYMDETEEWVKRWVKCEEKNGIPFSEEDQKIYIKAFALKSEKKDDTKDDKSDEKKTKPKKQFKIAYVHEFIAYMQRENLFKTYSDTLFKTYFEKPDYDENKILNTFNPNAMMQRTKKDNIDMKKIGRVRNHLIKVLCNGNEQYALYVEKWLSHLIQYPQQKIKCPIWLVFYSKDHGVGKNLFFDMAKLMFGDYYLFLDKFSTLTGQYNDVLFEKIFGVIDELPNGDTYQAKLQNQDVLKTLISNYSMNRTAKYLKDRKDNLPLRCVMFTNHENALHIQAGDRRLVVIECGDKESKEYYETLAEDIYNKDVVQEYFNYLVSFDLSKWNPTNEKEVPKTVIKERWQLRRAPPHVKFLIKITQYDEECWEFIKRHTTKALSKQAEPDKLVIDPKRLFELFKRKCEGAKITLDTFIEILESDLKMVVRKGSRSGDLRLALLTGDGDTTSKCNNYCYSLSEIVDRIDKWYLGKNITIKDEKHAIDDGSDDKSDQKSAPVTNVIDSIEIPKPIEQPKIFEPTIEQATIYKSFMDVAKKMGAKDLDDFMAMMQTSLKVAGYVKDKRTAK